MFWVFLKFMMKHHAENDFQETYYLFNSEQCTLQQWRSLYPLAHERPAAFCQATEVKLDQQLHQAVLSFSENQAQRLVLICSVTLRHPHHPVMQTCQACRLLAACCVFLYVQQPIQCDHWTSSQPVSVKLSEPGIAYNARCPGQASSTSILSLSDK